MTQLLPDLSPAQLEGIAEGLERGRLVELTAAALSPFVPDGAARAVAGELVSAERSIGRLALAPMLRVVATERRIANSRADRRLEFVWTGPQADGAGVRDTSVVVRELFQEAEESVLVAGFALYNARHIFEPLAERMRTRPGLRVRLCLNIHRRENDARPNESLIADFSRRFIEVEWPRRRVPDVFFDPRSLETDPSRRAVLHAKCVVVDDSRAFVTSANLTEAAQFRNVEAGILVNDSSFAALVRAQFDGMVARGELLSIPL